MSKKFQGEERILRQAIKDAEDWRGMYPPSEHEEFDAAIKKMRAALKTLVAAARKAVGPNVTK